MVLTETSSGSSKLYLNPREFCLFDNRTTINQISKVKEVISWYVTQHFRLFPNIVHGELPRKTVISCPVIMLVYMKPISIYTMC